jgi:hypothetical protein
MKADSVFYGVITPRLRNDSKWINALLLTFGCLVLLPTNSSLDEQGNGDKHVHSH